MADWLLVDVGNSRLKWGWWRGGGELSEVEAAAYPHASLEEALEQAWAQLPRPQRLLVSSVAGSSTTRKLTAWVSDRWRITPRLLAGRRQACGLYCGYERPQELGADRWAAMIAAHRYYPDGCCVVDCGTAITLDAIAGGGRHLGGFILPGLEMMSRALRQGTAMDVVLDAGSEAELTEWGTGTASCIRQGSRKAVVALVETSLERLQARGVCDPVLVLTGGQMDLLAPLIQVDYQRHDNLVLEGLMICASEQAA